jgi:hypothetical protein
MERSISPSALEKMSDEELFGFMKSNYGTLSGLIQQNKDPKIAQQLKKDGVPLTLDLVHVFDEAEELTNFFVRNKYDKDEEMKKLKSAIAAIQSESHQRTSRHSNSRSKRGSAKSKRGGTKKYKRQ